MEAAIINVLDRVRGGSLHSAAALSGSASGRYAPRWHGVRSRRDLEPGKALPSGVLEGTRLSDYDALLVNACETSTGVLYDLDDLGRAWAE